MRLLARSVPPHYPISTAFNNKDFHINFEGLEDIFSMLVVWFIGSLTTTYHMISSIHSSLFERNLCFSYIIQWNSLKSCRIEMTMKFQFYVFSISVFLESCESKSPLISHVVLCARVLVYQIFLSEERRINRTPLHKPVWPAQQTHTPYRVSSHTRITQTRVNPANGRVCKCEQRHGQCQVPQLYCPPPPWGGSIVYE